MKSKLSAVHAAAWRSGMHGKALSTIAA